MPIQITTRLVPIPGIKKAMLLGPPLGLLAPMVGKWQGNGFNTIFRPMQPSSGSDNFLELNLTNETLEFTEIPGEIPNRGLVQGDISLFGMTYLQQIADANVKDTNGNPAGIHIEPGIWINIPSTTNPIEQATVARLANIPHGTSLVAQGTAQVVSGPPVFPVVDITPFSIGNPASKVPFPSQNLGNPSPFRSAPADIVGVTQGMVDDPNSVLAAALVGKTISSTTVIQISTRVNVNTAPDVGGGISDIAFLDGTNNQPNAQVVQMDATFWISDFTDASGSGTLLQYSQIVFLNFAPLSWPHVSVANLIKQVPKSVTKDTKDMKEMKETKETKDTKDAKNEVKDNKPEFKEHKPEIKEHKPEFKEHKPEIKETKPEFKEHKPEIKETKPEIKEFKEAKVEVKETEFPDQTSPDPGPLSAGPAASASGQAKHFIQPGERPAVGDDVAKEPPKKR